MSGRDDTASARGAGAGRVLMVTGATGGVGRDMARRAADAGYRLVLVARRAERLGPLADEIGADRVLCVSADVTDWKEMAPAVDAARERFGRVDAVFANAGMVAPASFFGRGGAEPEDWREMVLTNVYGTALTARAALPELERTGGHLLLMGSVSGRITRPGLYSATKWAVTALAASIRAEAVGTGVRVTLVQPGVIDTGLLREDLRSRPMLDPGSVSGAVLYALAQPTSVDIGEIVLRPTGTPADC
ncbi:SDR family oxidoreductase [Streptomyces sp. NPDC058001]|uniref:SDR family oxidoreductase n=1 Tax=Streptomyces sp. NPDC058001 TaxID=3346300 RepID=UPI0036F0FFFD